MTSSAPTYDVDLDALERDPFPVWERLRQNAPVAWVPQLGAYVVTRWDDVVRVARDADAFSAAVHDSPLSTTLGPNLLHSDDPEHAAQRAPVTQLLRPARIMADLRPVIENVLDELVAGLAQRAEADLIADLAEPLAHRVLRDVIGLPDLTQEDMRRWVHSLGAGASNFHGDPDIAARAAAINHEIDGALREAVKAGPPTGSLLHVLAEAPFQQLRSTAKLLVIGGLQEPRDLFGLAALPYLTDGAVRRSVEVDPQRAVPLLVEEALRWGSPVGTITRVTTRPVLLSGVQLPAGAVVAGVLASANHDPARWTQPDRFDLERDDLHHLAFAAGVHTCAGASLARLEVTQALHALIPLGAELLAEPDVRGWEFRGPLSLPVRLRHARRHAPAPAVPHTDRLQVTVTRSEDRGDVRILTLQGEPLPTWEPGAHIDVLLPGGLVRQYSLCGSPAADAWEIAVRRAPDSRGGSSWLHTHGRPGTTLEVRGPRNHFRLAEGPALFIAGGIGITPVVPMVERLAGTGHAWHLHYLTRGAAPFAERLAPFGDRVTHYDTSCGPRPDVRALLRDADPNATVYCCGPSALLDAVTAAAASGTEVQVEHFAAPAGSLELKGERSFSVRLSRTGLEVAVGQDETVLDALERSGVFLPSSCREGVCGSCELPLLEGDADHRGSVPSDGATFLSCVSRARSGDLVLDY